MVCIASKTVCGKNQCFIFMSHKLTTEELDKINFENLIELDTKNIAIYSLPIKNKNIEAFINSEEFKEKLFFFATIYELSNMLDTYNNVNLH